MRPTALLALLVCAAGCAAGRPDAVDVPAAGPAETSLAAVAPVVRVVAGRPDTLVVADLLGPGREARWGESADVSARDAGDGRVVIAAREGFSGLAVVPFTVDGAAYGLAVEAAVEPTVTFTYTLEPGRPAPAAVHVIGAFNDWSRTTDRLVPTGAGTLALTRAISPGRYEYKLVVDGVEVLDPASRDSTLNPFGAYNNVLTVTGAAPGRLLLSPATLDATDPSRLVFTASREGPDGTATAAGLGVDDVVALVGNERLGPEFVDVRGDGFAVDLAAMPPGPSRLRVAVRQGGLVSRWTETLLLDGHPLGEAQAAAALDSASAAPFVWQDAVVYQVVLDRFRNGDPSNDAPVVTAGLEPAANYHGGDLQGLLDAVESGYFTDLGVNTLWLSPVYDNPPGAEREFPEPHRLYTGYHGYWPSHPRAVDEHLGDMALLKRTVAAAHSRGLRVLLDVVAHHVHDSHPYVQQRPDWFGQLELPDGSLNLRRWDDYRLTTWFEPYLPTFDFTASEEAVNQVTADAVWWLQETGADGFRHDAVKHVPNAFWRALTKRVHEEAAPGRDVPVYQIGETFGSYGLVSSYVVPGQLDAQFNFLLYDAAVAALARGASMRMLADEMDRSLAVYGPLHVMGNLLDSHDKTRFMAYADGDVPPGTDEVELGWGPDAPRVDSPATYRRMELALAYLMTTPGVPVVYYGDEVGMTGAADPDNRRPMPWPDQGASLAPEQTALRDAASRLAALRRDLPALRHGAFDTVQATETLWVYRRRSPGSDVVVALNTGAAPAVVRLAGVPVSAAVDALDASAPVAGPDGLAFSVPAGGYRVVTVR
ncbi:MAG TPA: alpha-amylase family glycosyl hydrolase [Rubricoccaceae bacterium]